MSTPTMDGSNTRNIYIETTGGDRFEAEVPCDLTLENLAAEFFEDRGWPTTDQRGRGQKAVVELVDPSNKDNTKRLRRDANICDENVRDGDTLRIFPESIAGAADPRARKNALITDHNEMQQLIQADPHISFTTNKQVAPDEYTVTFTYPSFVELRHGQGQPRVDTNHIAVITLNADYPRAAPVVRWQTPIFHPNISPATGSVCLGALMEHYLPGMGLAGVVRMLAEMLQWKNFDAYNAFDRDAAEWARDTSNWQTITDLGGHPFQGPLGALYEQIQQVRKPRPAITFKPVSVS